MRIVNLTPHEVNVVGHTPIPPSGNVARVTARLDRVGSVCGIPVSVSSYGDVCGLPPRSVGVAYVVSRMVAQRCPDRDDLYYPEEPVRSSDGRVIGCMSLGRVG